MAFWEGVGKTRRRVAFFFPFCGIGNVQHERSFPNFRTGVSSRQTWCQSTWRRRPSANQGGPPTSATSVDTKQKGAEGEDGNGDDHVLHKPQLNQSRCKDFVLSQTVPLFPQVPRKWKVLCVWVGEMVWRPCWLLSSNETSGRHIVVGHSVSCVH